MKVVIVGMGEVGTYLAKILSSQQKHNVIGIDTDKTKLDSIKELYDIHTIHGYGAAPYILKDAETPSADYFIAVSSNDEVNLISALIARKIGAKFTIARVSNPFYLQKDHLKEYEALGIDLLISPERRTALKIYQSIEYPQFLKVDTLGQGKVHICQLVISQENPFADKKIKDISLSRDILIVGISRNRDFLFPTGETKILVHDSIFIVAKKDVMQNVGNFLPVVKKEIKRVILIGASNINFFLARMIQNTYRTILIENDLEKSNRIASFLDKTAIYNEDIFASTLLDELLLTENDFFVVATEYDNLNLLASLLLRNRGVERTACITHKSQLLSTVESAGVKQVFSPQIIISNDIASVMRTQELLSLSSFQNSDAEFVELTVEKDSPLTNRRIDQAKLPKNTLFVAVLRGESVYIPRGDYVLEKDDRLIVLCKQKNLKKIEALLSS